MSAFFHLSIHFCQCSQKMEPVPLFVRNCLIGMQGFKLRLRLYRRLDCDPTAQCSHKKILKALKLWPQSRL